MLLNFFPIFMDIQASSTQLVWKYLKNVFCLSILVKAEKFEKVIDWHESNKKNFWTSDCLKKN